MASAPPSRIPTPPLSVAPYRITRGFAVFAAILILATGALVAKLQYDTLSEQVRRLAEGVIAVRMPFLQGNDVLSRQREGVGVGLALAARTTEALGGTFDIVTGRDRGTCIAITLPEIPAGAGTALLGKAGAEPSATDATPPPTGGASIHRLPMRAARRA